ncbi:hypothetical protein [Pectobacterium parmentieri]|nr:hypothetical protein [Pectobacterium parmentieri]
MMLSRYQAEEVGQKKRWLQGRPPCVLARQTTENWLIVPVA